MSKRKLTPRERLVRDYPTDRVEAVWPAAIRAIGDEEGAAEWLSYAHRTLGNQIPLELAATAAGLDEVERALLRIEHGVFS